MDTRCRIWKYFFHSVCWVSTALLLGYWIYLFLLDEDICLVDYKKYYDIPDHTFPVLSFCLKDPFPMDRLRPENSEITPEIYSKFLQGKYFSLSMLRINYSDVVLDASKYVDRYWINWRNGSDKIISISNESNNILIPSFAGIWDNKFYNCYALQVPHDSEINAFSIGISSSIFPGGIRTNDYRFLSMLHGRNQLLISGSVKYNYPRREPKDFYKLRYKVKGVELIRRRNKRNRPCYKDWTNYDAMIMENHAKVLGCTPPYFNPIPNIPYCSNKDQMAASPLNLRFDDYGTHPPCEGMEKIDLTFEEHVVERAEDDIAMFRAGYFWFGLYIYDQKFKEIEQIKAIDIHGLIGYIGGYIGLILGYSILKIPEYFVVLIWKFKDYYSFGSKTRTNILPITVQEKSCKIAGSSSF